MLFPLLSVGHALKINPLTDFALEALGVQMDEECVGVSLRTAIKKPLCVDAAAAHTVGKLSVQCWVLFFPAAGMSLS